jgi:biopolymer transport protein ExbD
MGFKLKKTPMEEAEMDITPMIDCTFLLLIFFVLTSKMDATKALDLPEAKYGANAVEQNSVVIVVAKGDGDASRVYLSARLDESKAVSGTPEDQEKAVAEYVTAQMRENPLKKAVIIKAAGGVKHRDVARIAKAAATNEDVTVEQLYMGIVQEKQ